MKHFFSLLTGLLICLLTYSQKIRYDVAFPNMVHHEAEITLTVSDIEQQPAIFRMSRSSPGRYATHEFGKNVYNVKAFDKAGKNIPIERVEGDVYQVLKHPGYIRIVYTLYGNHADGTYAGIDPNSIHFNMPATFLWIRGYDNAPIEIHFNIPEDKKWTIATQLKPTGDAHTFTAPGLQYFMDSPVKIGDLVWEDWTITNPDGKTYDFRLALEAESNNTDAAVFSEKVALITREAQAVFGEVPDFDYGSYTFIASINPYVHSDGMEHRNSTMITIPRQFSPSNNLLSVFSHEFFHAWNVERIRPKTLEPFNFEKSNMSSELWFAEGFTQYYGNLLLIRAGLLNQENFLNIIASLINTKENTPGARQYSPAAMSRNAVFVDAGVAIDKTNFANMHTSYYPYGGAIALALELELRGRFELSLDDYMTAVWKKFGRPQIPYTISDLEAVLAQLTKSNAFARDFFARYINGHESLDYAPLLEKAGLLLQKTREREAWIGNLKFREDYGLSISSNTLTGTPAYEAGLDIDDRIVQLDGKPVNKEADISAILEKHQPGDTIPIVYRHRDEEKTATLTLAGNPFYSITTFEKAGRKVTPEMLAFRKNWLGTKIRL